MVWRQVRKNEIGREMWSPGNTTVPVVAGRCWEKNMEMRLQRRWKVHVSSDHGKVWLL